MNDDYPLMSTGNSLRQAVRSVSRDRTARSYVIMPICINMIRVTAVLPRNFRVVTGVLLYWVPAIMMIILSQDTAAFQP